MSNIKLSYGITVCTELEEIQKLLPFLFANIRKQDEIVVLYDEENGDEKVWQYLNLVAVTDNNLTKGFHIHSSKFYGHFANWKNYLNLLCSGDYIFNIDADEMPTDILISNISNILELNPTVDVINVNRVNTVEGITQEHISRWGWRVDQRGYINWPDHQMRIYKNKPEIQWSGKVHEKLIGYKELSNLPDDDRLALKHAKTIQKQEKQNNFYDTL